MSTPNKQKKPFKANTNVGFQPTIVQTPAQPMWQSVPVSNIYAPQPQYIAPWNAPVVQIVQPQMMQHVQPQRNMLSSASAGYPPSLQTYVEKLMNSVHGNPRAKSFVEVYVKKLISKATEEGILWTKDWKSEPMPTIPSNMLQKPSTSTAPVHTLNNTLPKIPKIPKKTPMIPQQVVTQQQPKNPFSFQNQQQPVLTFKQIQQQQQQQAAIEKQRLAERQRQLLLHQQQVQLQQSKKRPLEQDPVLSKKKQKIIAQAAAVPHYINALSDVNNYEKLEGTSTDLEKGYLRLTSAPDPSTVRPEPVLKKSIEYVFHRFYREKKEYLYICEQLKSIRQDLTVQRIKSDFTVEVYERHARIALENADLSEFNQCQTQLKELYASGLNGSIAEFTAYRLMYLIFTDANTDLSRELKFLLADTQLRNSKNVKYAMQVLDAMNLFNFYKLFSKLYRMEEPDAPPAARFLINLFIQKLRKRAVYFILKSHSPTNISVLYMRNQLGYTSDDEDDFITEIIQGYKLIICDDMENMDCKRSLASLEDLDAQQALKDERTRNKNYQ